MVNVKPSLNCSVYNCNNYIIYAYILIQHVINKYKFSPETLQMHFQAPLTWGRWSTCCCPTRCSWPGSWPLSRTAAETLPPDASHSRGTSWDRQEGKGGGVTIHLLLIKSRSLFHINLLRKSIAVLSWKNKQTHSDMQNIKSYCIKYPSFM